MIKAPRKNVTEKADEPQGAPYFDGVFVFLSLLVLGIVTFVALLYGFFWLMFDSEN